MVGVQSFTKLLSIGVCAFVVSKFSRAFVSVRGRPRKSREAKAAAATATAAALPLLLCSITIVMTTTDVDDSVWQAACAWLTAACAAGAIAYERGGTYGHGHIQGVVKIFDKTPQCVHALIRHSSLRSLAVFMVVGAGPL